MSNTQVIPVEIIENKILLISGKGYCWMGNLET